MEAEITKVSGPDVDIWKDTKAIIDDLSQRMGDEPNGYLLIYIPKQVDADSPTIATISNFSPEEQTLLLFSVLAGTEGGEDHIDKGRYDVATGEPVSGAAEAKQGE